MTDARRETDSLGVVEVPGDKLWGTQTQRSPEHFGIGGDLIPRDTAPRHFSATRLDEYIAATTASPIQFRVLVNGRPSGAVQGVDVDEQGNGSAQEPRLYQLVRQPGPAADQQLEIEFLDAGAEAFSLTFG